MPAMERDRLRDSVLAMWRRNNDILLFLLAQIPPDGLAALPTGSKGRDVAAQFAHLDRVRRGWVEYFTTGKRPGLSRYDKTKRPTKAQLRAALAASGRQVEVFLDKSIAGEIKPRMFGRDPMRWCGYLIAHDSHHRGQILLALKQSGHRLPGPRAIEGVWGTWIYGK
jgi:uncharacterized damage-inducible protein DinB